MKLVDLAHTFRDAMPVYPGDPEAELRQSATIEKQGFTDHILTTGMHVGTHIDAPLHMLANEKKISEIPIQNFIGNGILLDARRQKEIDASVLRQTPVAAGDIVLILTGFSKHFGTKEYFENYPTFTKEFAELLINNRVKMVGMDTPSPDMAPYEIHKLFLHYDILIIENLTNLAILLGKRFEVYALPLKLDADASPVRVIAKIL